MNILYLNNSVHLGGDTKCILKLCKELKHSNKVIMASNGGSLINEFEKMGIKHYKIKPVSSINIFSMIFNIILIIKIVKKESIDIIHSHHRMTTLMSKIASKFVKVKVVHTQHLCIENKFFLTRLTLNNIKTITVSEGAKEILKRKCKLNEKNITTIYNTIELECKNKEVDLKLLELKEKGFFLVAQVSRIIDYKGVYDFVDVAESTVKNNKDIRFLLIGEGEESENLKKYIKQGNLEEYVYVLGSKDNVIEHLKYIDLVLLCSHIEGLPLVPLEAFSERVPVIATNIEGTKEEIVDGENGFLVEPKNIEVFTEKINDIFNNKELYNSLKENAYKIFKEKFDVDRYIAEHVALYNKVLYSE
ncbi:glycosyltransferase [Clostridium sp. DSM 100503]|uniref:glycosyltransferase n=1 Tax=Clostridium sp. DSM 100503 TaxID=2963282 RepID=UPI00214A3DF7|nr:glycosyltransferase [Clostridium sp. DSM 100503]MCR1951939.1 glycosyltransferase [Clostridium sp. DSM 100503]